MIVGLKSSIHFLQGIRASTKTLLAKPLLCSQMPQVDLSENVVPQNPVVPCSNTILGVYQPCIPHLQTPISLFLLRSAVAVNARSLGPLRPRGAEPCQPLKLLNHRRSQFVPFSCSKIGRNEILRISRIGSSRFCKLMGPFLQGYGLKRAASMPCDCDYGNKWLIPSPHY